MGMSAKMKKRMADDYANLERRHGKDLVGYHRSRNAGNAPSRAQTVAHELARGSKGKGYAGVKKKKKKNG